jgi:hypothetical protein
MMFNSWWALVLMAALAVPAHAADPISITSDLERSEATSDKEKEAAAASARSELKEAVDQARKLRDAAKKSGNDEVFRCVETKLVSLEALKLVVDNSGAALSEAIASGEGDRAEHEYRKITVARSKGAVLLSEANQCAGGDRPEAGKTVTEMLAEFVSDEEVQDVLVQVDLLNLEFGADPPQTSPFL